MFENDETAIPRRDMNVLPAMGEAVRAVALGTGRHLGVLWISYIEYLDTVLEIAHI